MMLMGEQLDPQQPPMPPNLPQAKDIIDLLSVLEHKTTGNLTTEEQAELRDMLYALRMKYVSVEHIPQHRLFFRREITRSLVFQDREQVDNVFRLR